MTASHDTCDDSILCRPSVSASEDFQEDQDSGDQDSSDDSEDDCVVIRASMLNQDCLDVAKVYGRVPTK